MTYPHNNTERINIFGTPIDALTMGSAVSRLEQTLESPQCQYVCAVSVHGLMEAEENASLRQALECSAINLPDGMPLAWIGRALGLGFMQRVTGPDVMLEMFSNPAFSGLKHYFYGGQDGVAQELQQRFTTRFPKAAVVGTHTPPFRELTTEEEAALLRELDLLKPDVVWVGIGCPKQEIFMSRMASRMPAKLMVGVGAAFDFHTGRLRDCSPWVKALGLQWLHRLLQDPRRLWRRYLKANTAFVAQILLTPFRPHSLELITSNRFELEERTLHARIAADAKTMR